MSTYDRRTWQRAPGERTTDPYWVEEVREATGRRGTYRTPNYARHRDRPIYGNLGYQYRALIPRYRDVGGEGE